MIAQSLPKTSSNRSSSKKPANMKFGSLGGISRIQVEPSSIAKTKEESDDEADWPGKIVCKKVKAGISRVAEKSIGASPPNRNERLT